MIECDNNNNSMKEINGKNIQTLALVVDGRERDARVRPDWRHREGAFHLRHHDAVTGIHQPVLEVGSLPRASYPNPTTERF